MPREITLENLARIGDCSDQRNLNWFRWFSLISKYTRQLPENVCDGVKFVRLAEVYTSDRIIQEGTKSHPDFPCLRTVLRNLDVRSRLFASAKTDALA